MATTVTIKGQVTIPKPIRDRLGLKPGSRVRFRVRDDGATVIEAEGNPEPDVFERFRGHAGPGLTTDELMQMLRGDDD
jgi:antitoxin PrlF